MKKSLLFIIISLCLCFDVFPQEGNKIVETPNPCFIRLKVEFLASGKVGNISFVSSSCNDKKLENEAVEAAKKVKFEPKIENGTPVTVTKQVEYFFTLNDEKAEAILKLAVEKLGGERYLQVKTQVSTGYFTQFRDGVADLPNSFLDVIAFPDKERTEFKQLGNKIIQTNFGEKGWIYDGGTKNIREQDKKEIDGFKRTLRTSVDSLLRGGWRNQGATLSYVGRREAGIGKRNEVVKLIYSDGFAVEFEFSAVDGMPMKSLYKGKDSDEAETKEEDRYAQFVEVQGVLVPFIVDHHINGKQMSRINYSNIQLNKSVPDGIFNKPADVKDLKKDLKL